MHDYEIINYKCFYKNSHNNKIKKIFLTIYSFINFLILPLYLYQILCKLFHLILYILINVKILLYNVMKY